MPRPGVRIEEEGMEFNSVFNPAVILLGSMIWIGLFGLYGLYLERKDQENDQSEYDDDENTLS